MDTPPPESPPPLPAPTLLSPIAEKNRHQSIDALRGFAIFGIFLVNMAGFKAPMMVTSGTGERWLEGTGNEVTSVLIEIFAAGKFVPMFALLFGMGMVMQANKSRTAGRRFAPFFLRRMFVLLFLGILHGIFLWAGDVLALYALCGMAGLLFLRCQPRTLMIWTGLVFGSVLMMLMVLLAMIGASDGSEYYWYMKMGEWWAQSYQAGTFGEILVARLAEWGMAWSTGIFFYIPYVFAFFLLGMALGKLEFLEKFDLWQSRLRGFAIFALPAGLAFTLIYVAIFRGYVGQGTGAYAVGMVLFLSGSVLLALAYVILFALLVRSGRFRGVFEALAAVGRLALSNYLLQSIVANVIFMSWGFQFYGTVNAQTGVLIVVSVFLMQVVLSRAWLRNFESGPFEWGWRALAYGSVPRLRRRAS